jgi:hypothetical protein
MYSVTLGAEPVTRSRRLSNGISALSALQASQDFDQPLSFAQSETINEDNDLLFGRGVEEVAWHCLNLKEMALGHSRGLD